MEAILRVLREDRRRFHTLPFVVQIVPVSAALRTDLAKSGADRFAGFPRLALPKVFSGSMRNRKSRRTRGFRTILRKALNLRDWMVDEAVCREPFSGQIPCLAGKEQGILHF